MAPGSTAEAASLLRACRQAQPSVAVHIRGSQGDAELPPAGIRLSTAKLRGIRAYAPDDLYVTVGAGTPLVELQARLAEDKRWVPLVSPWPAATVGGIVASNFNAPLRMRQGYGGLRDLVLAATVILPDGRTIAAGRPLVKNVAGYDLAKLFVGSFGTLGLIAEVSFKLLAVPRCRMTLAVPFEGVDQALLAAAGLLPGCIVASALLLCSPGVLPGLPATHTLLYTAEGLEGEVAAEMDHVRRLLGAGGVSAWPDAGLPSGSDIWARWLASASADETVLRLGVTLRDLPLVMRGELPFVADLASGLVYVRGSDEQLVAPRRAARAAGGYAVALQAPAAGGRPLWDYEPDSLALMRAIKARWDPQGLCNPGSFLL